MENPDVNPIQEEFVPFTNDENSSRITSLFEQMSALLKRVEEIEANYEAYDRHNTNLEPIHSTVQPGHSGDETVTEYLDRVGVSSPPDGMTVGGHTILGVPFS